MRYLTIILLFIGLSGFGQFNEMLLASQAQYVPISAYDADSQAFFDAALITNTTQKDALNDLVLDLKEASLWTKLDVIYPIIGGTASSHKYNLKDPRDLNEAHKMGMFSSGTATIEHDKGGMKLNSIDNSNYATAHSYYQNDAYSTNGVAFNLGMFAYSNYALNLNSVRHNLFLAMWNGDGASAMQVNFFNGESGTGDVYQRHGGTSNSFTSNVSKGIGFFSSVPYSTSAYRGYIDGLQINDQVGGTRIGKTSNMKGIAIGGLHTGVNPPTAISHLSPDHGSIAKFSFVALGPNTFTGDEVLAFSIAVEEFQQKLGRHSGSISANKITNPNFENGATGWTLRNGSTIANGVATVIGGSSGGNGDITTSNLNWSLEQGTFFKINTDYLVKFKAKQTVGTGGLRAGIGYNNLTDLGGTLTASWDEYYDIYNVGNVYDGNFVVAPFTTGDEIQIKDITIMEIKKDDVAIAAIQNLGNINLLAPTTTTGVTYTAETTTKKNSAVSTKITVTSGQQYPRYQVGFNIAANGLVAGDKIRVQFDYENTVGSGNGYFELIRDNTSTEVAVQEQFAGTGWKTYAYDYVIPAGLTTLDLWFYPTWTDTTISRTIYIDNLILNKI